MVWLVCFVVSSGVMTDNLKVSAFGNNQIVVNSSGQASIQPAGTAEQIEGSRGWLSFNVDPKTITVTYVDAVNNKAESSAMITVPRRKTLDDVNGMALAVTANDPKTQLLEMLAGCEIQVEK